MLLECVWKLKIGLTVSRNVLQEEDLGRECDELCI